MRLRITTAAVAIALAATFGMTGVASAQATHGQESTNTALSAEAQECIHLLEEGKDVAACQQAPSVILPAWNEVFWGGLSFVILLALMWKFAFPSIKTMMAARTERIRESLDEAERAKSESQRILEDYQRQLADAKNESARIIEEARQTAEQMRRDLMIRAESEINEVRERSRHEIEAAKVRALDDLRHQVSELAINAAEIVVQRNLDRDTNRALVERFIEQIGAGA
jgi:F-type H+-transporting ATPase subunit b